MKLIVSYFVILVIFFTFLNVRPSLAQNQVLIPVNANNRNQITNLELTKIGHFGFIRKSRPGIPEHLHTGIDIKRPTENYQNEPIFPISDGVVISSRDDGPYAQIIIEHKIGEEIFWSVYEHVSGGKVNVGEEVSPHESIARFMNAKELHQYGWQFDHFHLELLKIPPIPRDPSREQKQLFFKTYGLTCYTKKELLKRYYDPLEFFKERLAK